MEIDIHIPEIPKFALASPKLVLILDKIRYEIDGQKKAELFEFYWFAREYPRFYRYHIEHVKHRITTIHKMYGIHKNEFLKKITDENLAGTFEMQVSNHNTTQIYWDFESLLGATSSSLDILSRVIGIAFKDQTPPSLNKLVAKRDLTGPVDILRQAKIDWIDQMKDLRDCFVHYTPVDNRVYVTVYKLKKNWKMWCKIPINPNIRTVEGFKFSRKLDLLRYSINLYSNLIKLDVEIADEIEKLYSLNKFPIRTKNLFFVGQRDRKK